MGDDWSKIILEAAGRNILLLGEGNFSFAAAFLEETIHVDAKPARFVATAFGDEAEGSEDDVTEDCVRRIREKGGYVFGNIDATSLAKHRESLHPPFDCIVFNFPHVGGKMRLDKNRALLSGFLQSAFTFLASSMEEDAQQPQVWLSLCGGQGGTDFDEPKRRWDDSWQLPLIAARCGFLLTKVTPFPSHLITYRQTGYRGLRKPFLLGSALTHVLQKVPYSRVNKLPSWLGLILEKSTDGLTDEQLLSSCSPCDSDTFVTYLLNHEVTNELKERLQKLGEVRVVTKNTPEEGRLVNHPPRDVFFEVQLEPGRDSDKAILSFTSEDSFELAKLDFGNEIVRVGLLRFLSDQLNLPYWSDVFALSSSKTSVLQVNLCPLTFVHHLSVWKDASFDQNIFLRVLFDRFSLVIQTIKHLEDWRSEDGKFSALYEFTYHCRIVNFSDEACKRFHCWLLPKFLKHVLNVIVR